MNNYISVVRKILDLQYVERFNKHYLARRQSVAEHSYNASLIAFVLANWLKQRGSEIDPYRITVCTMLHDFSEVLTGDLEYWVKNHDDKFKKAWEAMETEMLEEFLGSDYEPTQSIFELITAMDPLETTVVKLADYFEFSFYALDEIKRGNLKAIRWLTAGSDIVVETLKSAPQLTKDNSPALQLLGYLNVQERWLSDLYGGDYYERKN